MNRFSWSLLLVFMLVGAGCSHMSYSRAVETERIRPNGHSRQIADGYDLEHEINELALLDRSGIVCGALTTTMEATSSAIAAEREAIREGKREYEYSYRQHSPAEYSGLDCGIYYRWGGGENNRLRLLPAANV